MSQRNAALSAVGAAKVVPGALVTPPHSSAAALSSSSYFSFPLSPAMPLTACHVHLFYATSSIPTFVFQPLLLLYLPYSSSYLHSAAARKNKNCLRMRVDKYRHTYLEARVNWTILPAQSFLQLIPGHYQDTRPRLQIAQ